MSGRTHTLIHPIDQVVVSSGVERLERITEIELRRPNGKDMRLIDQHRHTPMQLVLEMIVALSGLPMKTIEKLDAEDVGPLGELAFASLPNGPKTGETG